MLIVDEFTGRVLLGRRDNEGIHQAIEAKEPVEVKAENQTLATITLQNYFRLYDKLAGMTGTAQTEAAEFRETYRLGVVPIPTNKAMIREDQTDLIYKTEEAKYIAVVDDVSERYEKGQPVLIGTTSVERSEYLSRPIIKRRIPHNVLNAKYHEQEAGIIAEQAVGRHHRGHSTWPAAAPTSCWAARTRPLSDPPPAACPGTGTRWRPRTEYEEAWHQELPVVKEEAVKEGGPSDPRRAVPLRHRRHADRQAGRDVLPRGGDAIRSPARRAHLSEGRRRRDSRIVARKVRAYFRLPAPYRLSSYAVVKCVAHVPGPYTIPNVYADVYCVFTDRTRRPHARLRRDGDRLRHRMPDGPARRFAWHGTDRVPHPRRLSRRRHGGHRREAKNTALVECVQVAAEKAKSPIRYEFAACRRARAVRRVPPRRETPPLCTHRRPTLYERAPVCK